MRKTREMTDLSRDYNCDSSTIRLRYDDTTMHSTTTEVIEITICVRFDCDTTTIRLRYNYDTRAPASIRRYSTQSKNEHVNFSSQSCRSRIIVEYSNRNCDIGFSCEVAVSIGVGDRGQGGSCPPPSKKNSAKIFFGQKSCTIRAFFNFFRAYIM